MREKFRILAAKVSHSVGTPTAFLLALLTIVIWALMGPAFHYSDTWQLVINTSTTIITFLMVFLIQNAQNRDASAIHLKLNELLRGVKGARTELVNLEELSDQELESLHAEFHEIHERLSSHALGRGFDPERVKHPKHKKNEKAPLR